MMCPLQANPHKRLRHLYGQRMMSQYRNVGLGELSPHTYAIAEQVQMPSHSRLLIFGRLPAVSLLYCRWLKQVAIYMR